MTKKIKGWVDGIVGTRAKAEIASANWYAVKIVPNMIRAALVVGDERVFTESEVRAMIEGIINHVEGYYFDRAEIAELVAKHGIELDTP